jgi:hypothetical protein
MDDIKKGRMKSRKTIEQEVQELERNPLAQSLLKDLENQSPERTEQLLSELTTVAKEEGEANGSE